MNQQEFDKVKHDDNVERIRELVSEAKELGLTFPDLLRFKALQQLEEISGAVHMIDL